MKPTKWWKNEWQIIKTTTHLEKGLYRSVSSHKHFDIWRGDGLISCRKPTGCLSALKFYFKNANYCKSYLPEILYFEILFFPHFEVQAFFGIYLLRNFAFQDFISNFVFELFILIRHVYRDIWLTYNQWHLLKIKQSPTDDNLRGSYDFRMHCIFYQISHSSQMNL